MKFGKINVFKIAALILALVMCLSAVACGGDIATETEGQGVETEATEKPRFEGEALSVGDTVTMGAYFDETDDEMSALKWEVIKVEKDRALIITEKAIDQLPFEKTAYKAGTIINWESS